MRRLAVPISALLVLGAWILTASPASAVPTFRGEKDYFHCTGAAKLSNLNNAADDSAPTGWDTKPPSGSATGGAGCGALDLGAVREAGNVDALFAGTFTGNISDLTLHLYNFVVAQARTTGQLTVKVAALVIDGDRYVDNKTVNVTPVATNMGATELFELSVTGLGIANEDGDGTAKHEITLYIDTDPNQTQSLWVWDATEVPAGIEFNPASLATARIAATPPA